LDGKCTADDDIKCRRCFFKACHNPGQNFKTYDCPLVFLLSYHLIC
jgi:hypothetical protein